MAFTRQHYEAIAAILKRRTTLNRDLIAAIAYDMMEVFAKDNPNFDKARFAKACGL